MNKEIQEKIRACKALQGMSVADVIMTDRFVKNLAAYMAAQFEDRKAIKSSFEAMHALGGAKGYKLPAHPIDAFLGMSAEDMRAEYLNVLGKSSRLPKAKRDYIEQLGGQAYALTTAQYVCDEYPELKEVLIPTKQNN